MGSTGLAWARSLAIVLTAMPVAAQDAPPAAEPATTMRPADIPVEAFTSRAQLNSSKLSETGRRFAFVTTRDKKTYLTVHDAATREHITAIDIGDNVEFNWFRWAGDDKILVSVIRYEPGFLYMPRTMLMLFDVPTRKVSFVGFREQSFEGDDVLYTDPAGEYIILSVNRTIRRDPSVWRFPLDGQGSKNAVMVQKPQSGIEEWWADDTGVVRLGMGWDAGGGVRVYYRSGPRDEFRRVAKIKADDETTQDAWDVMGIYAGRDTGYALIDKPDGRTALHEVDYGTGAVGRLVYEHPQWAIESVRFVRDKGLVGVAYTADEPQVEWLDEGLRTQQASLQKALPGSRVDIAGVSANGERLLVTQSGPSDPGALYVFTPAERRLDLFANLRPQIDERLMGPTTAHDVTARDGTKLRAFLTLPQGREAAGLPLIVMPHGGPYGVRDSMVYDDWTMLLASRGYAVLRVNYRGSGGYGEAFERLGDGQIGRAMQDDLDDAMDWAVARGTVARDRVCLVGASYGGYAAMWGPLRNPERYRCGASFAGVTDWAQLLKYDKNYLGSGREGRRWYRKVWVPQVTGGSDVDMAAISVVDQIGRLQRPLFVAHGRDDKRVPIKQFDTLVAAARKAGVELDTLTLEDNHYLEDPQQEALMLNRLLAFLARHNPAQ